MKIQAYCDLVDVIKNMPVHLKGSVYPDHITVDATVVQYGKDRLEVEYFELVGVGAYIRDKRDPNLWHCYAVESGPGVIPLSPSLIDVIRRSAIKMAHNTPETLWDYEVY